MALGTMKDVVLVTRQGRMAKTSAHAHVNVWQYTKISTQCGNGAVGHLNMCAGALTCCAKMFPACKEHTVSISEPYHVSLFS
jgi:hypothetical protein